MKVFCINQQILNPQTMQPMNMKAYVCAESLEDAKQHFQHSGVSECTGQDLDVVINCTSLLSGQVTAETVKDLLKPYQEVTT